LKKFLETVGSPLFPVDEFLIPLCSDVYEPPSPLTVGRTIESGYAADLLEIDSFESVVARLSASSRYQLRAAIRKTERMGQLEVRAAQTRDEACTYFSGLKALHITQWRARNGSHGAFSRPYFEKFCQEMMRSNEIGVDWDILQISAGSVSIGYLFNLVRNGSISSYVTGFMDLTQGKYGYVSHALAMHHYAQLGFHTYDFLAKENQLKRTFATRQYVLNSHSFRKRLAVFQADSIARKVKSSFLKTASPRWKRSKR
jgi:CelD/BcsL family acetyltransferase involved in cellulose biosynthesis